MMFKHRDDLVKAVLGEDKNLQRARAQFARKLQNLYRNYKAQVEALLRRPRSIDKAARTAIARTQSIVDQMTSLLAVSGMDDIVADYLDEFPDLTRRALRYFSGLGEEAILGGVDVDRLDAYIDFSERRLRNIVDARLVKPMQEAVFSASFGDRLPSDIVAEVMARADFLTPTQVETVVYDTLVQYERAVTVEKAATLALDIFIYTGPEDEITSPQCEFLLNVTDHGLPGALYQDEISADLHENLRDNPLIAGGHPNCRHKYMPITEDYAVSLGFEPRRQEQAANG